MDSVEALLRTVGQAAMTESSSFHPMQRVNVIKILIWDRCQFHAWDLQIPT